MASDEREKIHKSMQQINETLKKGIKNIFRVFDGGKSKKSIITETFLAKKYKGLASLWEEGGVFRALMERGNLSIGQEIKPSPTTRKKLLR